MKIYIIPASIVDDFDKKLEEMTDEEVIALLKEKDWFDYDLFTDLKQLEMAWNEECIFSPFTAYMRVIDD